MFIMLNPREVKFKYKMNIESDLIELPSKLISMCSQSSIKSWLYDDWSRLNADCFRLDADWFRYKADWVEA